MKAVYSATLLTSFLGIALLLQLAYNWIFVGTGLHPVPALCGVVVLVAIAWLTLEDFCKASAAKSE
jgi:hypothetical protein